MREARLSFHNDRVYEKCQAGLHIFHLVCCRELESDSKLAQILQDQDLQKANLVIRLMEDSDLQKAAVGTLLERGDARSWGLLQQVRLVESQLVTLTNIEIDRKKLKMDEHLVCKDFVIKYIFKFNIEFVSIIRKCSYQALLFMELIIKKFLSKKRLLATQIIFHVICIQSVLLCAGLNKINKLAKNITRKYTRFV